MVAGALAATGLLAAGLPIPRRPVDPQGLAFSFLEELPDAPEPVLTGHDHGLITVSIGPAIDTTGKTAEEVTAQAEQWIEGEMRRLSPHRYPATGDALAS